MKPVFNNKLYKISILSFLLVIVALHQLSTAIPDYLAIALMLTIGLLHGSNDIFILSLSVSKTDNKRFLGIALLLFILLLLSSFALFMFYPTGTFALFLLYSAYHFGEEESKFLSKANLGSLKIWSVVYGLGVFFILILCNATEFFSVTEALISSTTFFNVVELLLVPSVVIQFIIILGNTMLGNISVSRFLLSQVQLLILYFLFMNTNLITGFVLYFILLHSLPSILHQIQGIRKNLPEYTIASYVKDSGPIYLISIAAILLLLLFNVEVFSNFKVIIPLLIAVTLPHVITIHTFYKKL